VITVEMQREEEVRPEGKHSATSVESRNITPASWEGKRFDRRKRKGTAKD
jgi:hypothetical protein